MINQVINTLIPQAYTSGGADAVRALLSPLGLPDETIADIIQQLGK